MLVINPSGRNARRPRWSPGIFFIFAGLALINVAAAAVDLKQEEASPWSETFTIRTGLGYKDNVSLSHFHPSSSPFLLTGADIEIFRLPTGNDWLITFLVTGDDWLYWENPGIDREDLWTGALNLRKKINDQWTFNLLAMYAYENLVIDLSTEQNFQGAPTKIQGNTLIARPSLRWTFATNWWTQLELDATRQFFCAPADSYTRFGPKIYLGHDYGHRSQIALSYQPFEQWYDTLKRTDKNGNVMPGGTRSDFRQRVELEDRHYWDAQRHWQNATKLSFEYSQDNGGGFFNYYRYGLGEELRYQTKQWDLKGAVTVVRYDYPTQPAVSPGGDKWNKTDVILNLRAERTLTKWAKVFAEYQYERSLSNRKTSDYQANTVVGGVEWVF